ncbi:MAG: hypothetical protein ACE14V_12640 [bacterium]
MVVTKLKAKNQVTIPTEIVKRLALRTNELFTIEVEKNYIRLTPVEIEPRYTPEEIAAIDRIVEKEKKTARTVKPGKSFRKYLNQLTE